MAARRFLQLAPGRAGPIRPRVINVDGDPAYPGGINELKQAGELGRNCRCGSPPYLNNVIEQDHRFVKKRVGASLVRRFRNRVSYSRLELWSALWHGEAGVTPCPEPARL